MCLSHHDLKIVTGTLATDSALERTAYLLDHVTEFVDPRVFVKMIKNQFRHAVMAAYPAELTTDIPEHSFLSDDPNTNWDERARGLGDNLKTVDPRLMLYKNELGATVHVPVGSSAEENALCYSDDRW